MITNKEINNWIDEWVGMPEYENVAESGAFAVATFKFRNQEDYEEFKNIVQEYAYHGVRVFDGSQKKDRKQTWYPHKEQGSKYLVTEEI